MSNPSPAAKIIQVSLDYRIHNGWSMDYQGLPTVDIFLSADPDQYVPDLVKALGAAGRPRAAPAPRPPAADQAAAGFTNEHMARTLRKVVGERPVTLTHLPIPGRIAGGPSATRSTSRLRWRRRRRRRSRHLGRRGAGAQDSALPVAICGDGDFLMGVTAVWTAVRCKKFRCCSSTPTMAGL